MAAVAAAAVDVAVETGGVERLQQSQQQKNSRPGSWFVEYGGKCEGCEVAGRFGRHVERAGRLMEVLHRWLLLEEEEDNLLVDARWDRRIEEEGHCPNCSPIRCDDRALRQQ